MTDVLALGDGIAAALLGLLIAQLVMGFIRSRRGTRTTKRRTS